MTTTAQPRTAWWRVPKPGPDGELRLVDHLRELRYRFLVSLFGVLALSAVCLLFYDQLLNLVLWPIQEAIADFQVGRPAGQVELVTQGITAGFSLYFRICLTAGFILSCPVWLFQLWRFIAPGLKKTEKKTAVRFLLVAIPLFLGGVVLGYFFAPRGFAVLLQFNPPQVVNLNELNQFLGFELRLLLVFGLTFLLPVVLVGANFIGLVSATKLADWRSAAIIGCAVFAAVATPTTDPFSMLVLLCPMVAMYLIAEFIARRHDKRMLSRKEGVE